MTGNFKDHFSSFASRYADCRPHYPPTLFEFLGKIVPTSSRVWDCAAGSGQATIGLAARFDRVIATDGSAEQIAAAPAHPRVEYLVALAEHSGLAEGSVDLVTVAQALHWFDLEKFYTEVRRVLTPGGVIAVWAYGINQLEDEVVNRIVQDYYHHVVGSYWPPERKLVEEGYRTIPFPFEELPCPAFRMTADWNLEQLLGYFGTWSATNRFRKAKGHDPLVPLRAALEKVWGDAVAPRTIAWPLAMRLGRIQKSG